jgi:hypothetical protein
MLRVTTPLDELRQYMASSMRAQSGAGLNRQVGGNVSSLTVLA